MKAIASATLIAVPQDGKDYIVDPTAVEASRAKSLHVLGFTSQDELFLCESEGTFSVDEWTSILELGRRVCCQRQSADLDTAMGGDNLESQSMRAFIRAVMQAQTTEDQYWK